MRLSVGNVIRPGATGAIVTIIIAIFEILGQILPYMNGQSFLFDTRGRFDTIFNEARLQIIILQVAIIGIIAIGVIGPVHMARSAITRFRLGHR